MGLFWGVIIGMFAEFHLARRDPERKERANDRA